MAPQTKLKPLVRSDLGPLAAEGQDFPLYASLDGTAVAVLPLADYKALLAASIRRPEVVKLKEPKPARGRPEGLSTIERDPDVAEFLTKQFRGGVTTAEVRAACVAQFGEERTPSIGRMSRFRVALRRA